MGKNIWDYLKNFGILIAVLVAMIQVADWVASRSESLEMELRFGNFAISPAVYHEFERLQELLETENIATEIELAEILGESPAEEEIQIAKKLLDNVSDRYKVEFRRWKVKPFRFLKGYWSAKVANTGKTALSNVVITLPHARYVSIDREGDEAVFQESTELIQIGKMRPGETVSVLAWTDFDIVTHYLVQVPTITHNSGVGKTSIFVRAGWIGQAAEQFWPPVRWFFISVLIAIALVGTGNYLERKWSNRKSAEAAPKEKEKETSQQHDESKRSDSTFS